jgi:hypothetical protein
VSLAREGVSDPVLVALIETDGSRFTLNADDIRDLRAQGLSDTVIVAMIRSARPARDNPRPVREQPAAPAPDDYAPAPPPAPAPVVVNQSQTVTQRVEVTREVETPVYVPVYVPIPARPVEVKKEEPVYWGWGGQRRPDAWKEPVVVKAPPVIKK